MPSWRFGPGRRLALLLVLAVSTASCSSTFNDVTVKQQSVETTLPGSNTSASAGPSTVDELAYDDVAPKMIASIDAFWTQQLPDVYGREYQTLDQGVFPLGPGDEAPGCDAPSTVYEDVAGNAFYCPDGDFIVYDDADLFPNLYTKFGPFVIGVVLAHEWGHAIQVRGAYPIRSPRHVRESGRLFRRRVDALDRGWQRPGSHDQRHRSRQRAGRTPLLPRRTRHNVGRRAISRQRLRSRQGVPRRIREGRIALREL